MILKCDRIAALLESSENSKDPLVVTPQPNLDELKTSGNAAIDLRLGTWFVTLRESRSAVLGLSPATGAGSNEKKLTNKAYIPFGNSYILHPRCFVLGVTMEWIRLPHNLAGYVVGKSSWGRRGIVIATAVGVHPGFSGCLTLEITNLGEVPVEIKPGRQICQLFLHNVESESEVVGRSVFAGRRIPYLGDLRSDPVADKLAAKL